MLLLVHLAPPLGIADNSWPKTVRDAVEILVSGMSDESKSNVAHTGEEQLILYHLGWGTAIRNKFGLWRGNTDLLTDCGSQYPDPENCSQVIIEAIWRRLRAELPTDYRTTLESMESALERVRVSPFRFEGQSLPDVVAHFNATIGASNVNLWGFEVVLSIDADTSMLISYSEPESVPLGLALRRFGVTARLRV